MAIRGDGVSSTQRQRWHSTERHVGMHFILWLIIGGILGWIAASHHGAAALQISMILSPLSPLSAVCFWDPRFAHDSNICRKNGTEGARR